MAQTKISGGTSAKGTAQTGHKTRKNAKPAQDFSAELAKTGRPAGAQKKPSRQTKGPEVQDYSEGAGKRLTIVDREKASGTRSVDIAGEVYRFNKHGDIVDGGPAHAGKVTKLATVTVSVTDDGGTTKKTYKGDQVRPMVVELGQDTRKVRVHGTFQASVTLAGKGPLSKPLLGELDLTPRRFQAHLGVDAVGAQFVGRNAQTGSKAQLTTDLTSTGLTNVTYSGSQTRDNVNIQTRGRVVVNAGPGDDVIQSRGGRESVVRGQDGNDVITAHGPRSIVDKYLGEPTQYEGGRGQDSFRLADPGAAKQITDFDLVEDR